MNSVSEMLGILDEHHPARERLLDIQAAAQRCVWKASGLLNFSARVNTSPIRASLEYLIDKSLIDH